MKYVYGIHEKLDHIAYADNRPVSDILPRACLSANKWPAAKA